MDVTRRHFVAALGATNLMAGLALPHEVAQDPKKIVQIGIVGGNFGATWQWHLHPNCKVGSGLRPAGRSPATLV